MRKLFVFVFLFSILGFGITAGAQMMGGNTAPSSAETAQTIKDEAEGKAVWNKLQDKQVTCQDLKDDDFDVLGDFFMGNMAGVNHTSMNVMMAQRLGDAGEKLMHIAIGKRLSGCDTTASFPQGAGYFTPMLGISDTSGNQSNTSWGGMMGYTRGNMMGGGLFGIFGVLTWLAFLIFSILGGVFFWKGIQKKD